MGGLQNTNTTSLRSMEDLVSIINGLRWTMAPKVDRLATRRGSTRRNKRWGYIGTDVSMELNLVFILIRKRRIFASPQELST